MISIIIPAHANRSSTPGWTLEESAPITTLLDHIAAELAAEYVRLMEDAGDRDDNGTAPEPTARPEEIAQ